MLNLKTETSHVQALDSLPELTKEILLHSHAEQGEETYYYYMYL